MLVCWHLRLLLLRYPVTSGCIGRLCHHGVVPGRASGCTAAPCPNAGAGPQHDANTCCNADLWPCAELDRCMKGLAALQCGKYHRCMRSCAPAATASTSGIRPCAALQELDWCMKELAALQKERNDWRCSSWLEGAVGRSTILAAPDEQICPGEAAAWLIWCLKVTFNAIVQVDARDCRECSPAAFPVSWSGPSPCASPSTALYSC